MVKKATEENKTYEYFRVEEVFITGKHRDYVDALWTQNKINESYIERLIDLYMIATAVGIRNKRKSPVDPSDEKRTIQAKQLSDNLNNLNMLMRMVIILDDSSGKSVEERIEEAFRIPDNYEDYKRNMNLFDSYFRGGLEILYDRLILKIVGSDDEDYGDAKFSNIMSFIKNPIEDIIE